MELGSKSLFSKKDRLQEWALRTIEFCMKGVNRKPYHELNFFFLNILFSLAKHRYIGDRSSLNRQREMDMVM